MLVSDLDDSPFDIEALTQEMIRYEAGGIDLRVVPLFPGGEDRSCSSSLAGPRRSCRTTSCCATRRSRSGARSSALPVLLVARGGRCCLLLLALNERVCARVGLEAGVSGGDSPLAVAVGARSRPRCCSRCSRPTSSAVDREVERADVRFGPVAGGAACGSRTPCSRRRCRARCSPSTTTSRSGRRCSASASPAARAGAAVLATDRPRGRRSGPRPRRASGERSAPPRRPAQPARRARARGGAPRLRLGGRPPRGRRSSAARSSSTRRTRTRSTTWSSRSGCSRGAPTPGRERRRAPRRLPPARARRPPAAVTSTSMPDVTFLSPSAFAVGLLALLGVGRRRAFASAARAGSAACSGSRRGPPGRWGSPSRALAAVGVLLGVAAAQPVVSQVRSRAGGRTRRRSSSSTSRARCSPAGASAPTRLERARDVAKEMRAGIPTCRSASRRSPTACCRTSSRR